ncbi:MAG TPA: hypothetical protein VIR01_05970 [Pyrinomonadaceae bacterium]|jgi:hypothetical protein
MSNARPEKVAGFVETHVVLGGTGSEHEGVVLTTDSGEQLRLQAIGGNPFSDPVTKRLVGHKVSLTGYRLGRIFRYEPDTIRELS